MTAHVGIDLHRRRSVMVCLNERGDAFLLADLLRMGRLPESWIPPHSIRELRELVRYRHKLSQPQAGLKAQVHAVLGKEGVIPHLAEMWGPAGRRFLNETRLGGGVPLPRWASDP